MLLRFFPPARGAVMALFFAAGFTYALWGVHVPVLKARFAFSDGALSLALFAVAGGALLAMGPLGRWIARVGSARACLVGGLCFAGSAAALFWMPNPWWLAPALVAFGAANSLFDVAMNAQASLLERLEGRPLMSRLHGLFSVGGLVGAVAGSAGLGVGLAPELAFALTGAAVVGLTLAGRPHFLAESAAPEASVHFPGLRGQLLALGGLAFIGLVAEGGMYDWTAVYLRDGLGVGQGSSGLGYAAFCLGMTLGRFSGDAVRGRWGAIRILQGSGLLVALGIGLAVSIQGLGLAVAGFALAGLGCANIVPILMSRGASLPGIAPAEAIAFIGRLAYLGLLLGPVFIGVTADHAGLAWGLTLVGLGALVISLGAGRALRPGA